MRYLIDTNVLLENPETIKQHPCVVTSHVLRELDKHKLSSNSELAFKARQATRILEENEDQITYDLNDYEFNLISSWDGNYVDNKLLQICVDNQLGMITNDLLLKQKCRGLGIEVLELNPESDFYTGVYDLYVDCNTFDGQQTLASLYENPTYNAYDLHTNQYLLVWDTSKPTYDSEYNKTGCEVVEKFKWNGEKLVKLKYKGFEPKWIGEKVKPINYKQELLFDLLQNNDITVKACFGKFGTGKDYCMVSHAIHYLDSKFDKIIWARNNINLKDVPEIGALPGDKIEKLIDFAMPLADHVGGVEGLKMLINQNKIEIQHLGSLRGRDIKRSLIYVTECQNNTDEHIKLLISRVGEGSQIWLNGDLKQTDKEVFMRKSGLLTLQKLKGNKLYGQVTLDKSERSNTASLADLLD